MAAARGGAAPSRRVGRAIAIGIALFGGTGPVLLTCGGAASLPADPPAAVERIEMELSRAGARELVPDAHAAYERRARDVRRLLREERDRWCWRRDPARAEEAVAALEREGEALLRAAGERRAALHRQTVEHVEATERRLGRLRAMTTALGMYLEPAPLAAAELALREARTYLGAGAVERVRELVERAGVALRRVEDQAQRQAARYVDGSAVRRWRRWVQEAVAASRAGVVLVVAKAERRLFVYRHGRVVADYPIALGFNALADKVAEGDGATPEGRFRIVAKKSGAETRYDQALLLDYPTPADRRRHLMAVRRGLVSPRARIGGLIEIHGEVSGPTDRTSGCVALAQPALSAIFDLVEPGTPVTIVGAASSRNPVAQYFRAWQRDRVDVL
jgi:hypothetical protein